MSDYQCPRCNADHDACGSHDDDAGERKCDKCGFDFIVEVDYEPCYDTRCVTHDFAHVVDCGNHWVTFCIYCSAYDPASVINQ